MRTACLILLLLVAGELVPVAWRSAIQLNDRYDTTPEFWSVQPYPLVDGPERVPHGGAYKAGQELTYAVERVATRTVTAKTTRRIVRIEKVKDGIVSRTPICDLPTNPNGSGIKENDPGVSITSYITVQLPDAKRLPPGDGYVIETSVEFPGRGDKDARTYTGLTQTFSVVE